MFCSILGCRRRPPGAAGARTMGAAVNLYGGLKTNCWQGRPSRCQPTADVITFAFIVHDLVVEILPSATRHFRFWVAAAARLARPGRALWGRRQICTVV